MKMKKWTVMSMLVCLLVGLFPASVWASNENGEMAVEGMAADEETGNERSCTWRIYHGSEILSGAKLTAELSAAWNSNPVIDYTWPVGAGELTLTLDPEDEQYAGKYIRVTAELPEGYEFMGLGFGMGEGRTQFTIGPVSSIFSSYENSRSAYTTNPSIDGTLSANISSMTVRPGDEIDVRGAWDSESSDFQLYHTAPDGTKTRVYIDCINDLSYMYTGSVEPISMEKDYAARTCKIYAKNAASGYLRFTYQNTELLFPITVAAEGENNSSGSGSVSGGNSAGSAPSVMPPSATSTETVYTGADGKEVRQIASSGNGSITIAGSPELIAAGMQFAATQVAAGESYERAVAAVTSRLSGYGSYQVFDMNLWDAAGAQMHQMGGYVNVTLPIPEGLTHGNGRVLTVYRLEDNGRLTRCSTAVRDGMLTFATNHFSTFVIVEQAVQTSPKTSEDEMPFLWAALALFMALGFAAHGMLTGMKKIK